MASDGLTDTFGHASKIIDGLVDFVGGDCHGDHITDA